MLLRYCNGMDGGWWRSKQSACRGLPFGPVTATLVFDGANARATLETTAFQGWRLCIARGGKSFTRYFSDKQCGGERGALKAAEAKLAELKGFLDSAPRKDGKLTKAAEAGARKVLEAG